MNFCLIVTALFTASLQTYAENGLIAHNNYYPGDRFNQLVSGDLIVLDCPEFSGTYVVSEILEYQAIEPDLFYGDGRTIPGFQLYREIFDHNNEIVLQTCIKKGDDYAWGRLFVIAVPVSWRDTWPK